MSEITVEIEPADSGENPETEPDVNIDVEVNPTVIVETPPDDSEDTESDTRIAAIEQRLDSIESSVALLAAAEVSETLEESIEPEFVVIEDEIIPDIVEDDAPRSQRSHWLFRPLRGPGGWIDR